MVYSSNDEDEDDREEEEYPRNWLDENFDVLQELYFIFIDTGERAFGYSFFQTGGFHDFVNFVQRHTRPDLLKH